MWEYCWIINKVVGKARPNSYQRCKHQKSLSLKKSHYAERRRYTNITKAESILQEFEFSYMHNPRFLFKGRTEDQNWSKKAFRLSIHGARVNRLSTNVWFRRFSNLYYLKGKIYRLCIPSRIFRKKLINFWFSLTFRVFALPLRDHFSDWHFTITFLLWIQNHYSPCRSTCFTWY